MWASGLWLPGWLSPECLVWYWLAGLGLGLAASQTERPELATLLTRLVLRLAAAHSVVVGLAYGYVLRTPSSAHVNEVYVVAAALNGLLLVGSVGWLVISAVRTPEVLLSYPAVGASTSRVRVFLWWGAVPLIVAGSYVGFAVVGRGVVHFVNGEHALDLVSVTLAFVLTALVCFANLWRGASTTTAQALGILALGGALLAQLGLSVFYAPARGMTDAGLVAAFDERVESAWLASQVMTELKSRHSTRLSAMAAAVHALRTEPQRLSQRVAASEAASRGSAGCSMPNLTPAPYDGRPELDLLGLLISRGELDEPRAWANDAGVPDELREALRVRLAKRP